MDKKSIQEMLLSFLFPKRCILCETLLPIEQKDNVVCVDCEKEIPYLTGETCMFCGRPIQQECLCKRCRMSDFAFEKGIACFSYETMQKPIAFLKFQGYRHDAQSLGLLMSAYLKQYHSDWLSWVDVMVCVPLHKIKQKRRGFNQAEQLCQVISKQLSIPFVKDVLVRTVYTIPQSQLSQQQRRENVKDVFAVANKQAIAGKRILLVDDIFTTGATVQYCSRALLREGANQVRVYCLSTVVHEYTSSTEILVDNQHSEEMMDLFCMEQ